MTNSQSICTNVYFDSMNDPEAPDTKDILTKGHNYVQGMQQQNKKWYKNQKDVKRQKMQKPSTD